MAKVNQLLALSRSVAGGLGSNCRSYIPRIHGSNCRSYFGGAVGSKCIMAADRATVMKKLKENGVDSSPIGHATPIKKKKKKQIDDGLDFMIACGGSIRKTAEWIVANSIEEKKKRKENAKEVKKKIRQMNRDIVKPLFDRWADDHNRAYESEEEREKRFQIFKKKLDHVVEVNTEEEDVYYAGLNQFSDMLSHEVPGCGILYPHELGLWDFDEEPIPQPPPVYGEKWETSNIVPTSIGSYLY